MFFKEKIKVNSFRFSKKINSKVDIALQIMQDQFNIQFVKTNGNKRLLHFGLLFTSRLPPARRHLLVSPQLLFPLSAKEHF